MKSHIMPGVALMVILFSGNIMAATNMTDNVTLNNDKISGQAWQAMRDIGMSRFELFNGRTQKAEQLAAQAEKLLNDDSTDWNLYVKSDKKAPVAYSALFDHGLASKSDQRFASIRSTG
ncbi:YfdX family protein, partial [Salmonella enterica]|uniref:YfdX family protein n=1 Tax=Salmonella sp. ZJHZ19_0069 TaxID=3159586 RepID=UPI0034E3AC81